MPSRRSPSPWPASPLTATLAAGGPEPTIVQNDLGAALGDALAQAAATSFGEISAPGAVMAVETPAGRWIATIGTQDMGTDGMTGTIPMTADLHQRIGSVTKTFTITALLQLVDQGLLSLDDPISDYVPGTPNPDATLGQLATMRSGIPSYTFNEEFQHILFTDPSHVWTPQQLVDLVSGQEPDFAPGTQTSYSNTNTVLLGMVIEKVTGQTLDQVITTGIIEPLGLTGTEFPTDATFAEPHAHGYTVQGQDDGVPADATDWNPSWGWAAGAMTSTLDDLLVYGEGPRGGRHAAEPIAPEGAHRLVRLQHPAQLRRRAPTAWGLAWPTVGTGTPESFRASTRSSSTTPPRASRSS